MASDEPIDPPLLDPAAGVGPLSDEPPMETDAHVQQMKLLLELVEWALRERQDCFWSGNLTIYFSPEQLKRRDFRGPDFFVVLGTERGPRNSWVVWDEGGKFPDVIVELLSSSTRDKDLGVKKDTYQDVFRTPEYYAFDPHTGELLGFELVGGRYRPRTLDATGRMWSERLGHSLGVEQGRLRLFTREGERVPTGLERGLQAEAAEGRARELARRAETAEGRARKEAQRAETAEGRARKEAQRAETAEGRAMEEAQRADTAERRAEHLAERLRALGVDPASG